MFTRSRMSLSVAAVSITITSTMTMTMSMMLAACHMPSGAWMPYTGATQTLHSTETSPKTVELLDTRTEEVLQTWTIPVGMQFTYDFIEGGGDDPVQRPDYMRWSYMPLGTTFGKLRNGLPVPNSASRRIDWFVREGVEYRNQPPEYRMRTDKLNERPEWWTPQGGPMPSDKKTTLYDG